MLVIIKKVKKWGINFSQIIQAMFIATYHLFKKSNFLKNFLQDSNYSCIINSVVDLKKQLSVEIKNKK
jgi:hypothetical protein